MRPADIGLPNGFHGALIHRITTDYVRRTAELVMAVLVSDSVTGECRHRGCKLLINGLAYLSLDVPDPHYDYLSRSPVEIGSLLETTTQILPSLTAFEQELGSTYFFNSFFVEEWNGFIHLAGTGVEFAWTEQ